MQRTAGGTASEKSETVDDGGWMREATSRTGKKMVRPWPGAIWKIENVSNDLIVQAENIKANWLCLVMLK